MVTIRNLIIAVLMLCFFNASAQKTDTLYTLTSPSENGTGKWYMGREIAQFMDFAGVSWLERNTRNKEENTDKAIAKLPLNPNSVVADIGAGSGFYTFRIAKHVPQGKVYAVEIQDDAISYLKNKAGQMDQKNVKVIKGGELSPNLPAGSIDLAIMVDVYHELGSPHEMLQAISKALKPNGKLLLLEYRAEDPKVAIKALHKMSAAQVNKELNANGFKLAQQEDFLPMQHYLVYELGE